MVRRKGEAQPADAPLGTHQRIYAAVRTVPKGRVTTYGTIARLAGLPRQARLVGYALFALRDGTAVPWHRVINARGQLSLELAGRPSGVSQRLRLEREGVRVDASGRVSLARFGWPDRETTTAPVGRSASRPRSSRAPRAVGDQQRARRAREPREST